MMKLAVTALTLSAVLSLSQAKTNTVAQVQDYPRHSVSMSQMQTKSVAVRAAKKTQRKFIEANDLTDPENDDLPGPDEVDLQVPYRRPSIVNVPVDPDEPLSDYITVRLAVARARAMARYRQIHL
jgi:hypothetical protein